MAKDQQSVVIDRGIALHKLIRLVTFMLGGEAWLNFMGNEFGHPEWIDFPREGNSFSFHYARRQWSLVDNQKLRYKDLHSFDKALQQLDEKYSLLMDRFIELILADEKRKLFIFRRGPMVGIVNFHPSESYESLQIGVPDLVDYKVVLSSDEERSGGFGRVKVGQVYPVIKKKCHGRKQSIKMYLPSRSAQVLAPRGRGQSNAKRKKIKPKR